MKLETILVPTDFSADAEHALQIAIELARQFGARIEILHAYHVDVSITVSPLAGGVVLPEGFFAQLRASAEQRVSELEKSVAERGVTAASHAVQDPAVQAIVDSATRLSADLIVMGTRGLSGLKHVLLGSVAERVVRLAPCPVMTVKADQGDTATG